MTKLIVKVFFHDDKSQMYIESEVSPNSDGEFEYDGKLHTKWGEIELENIISKEFKVI